MENNEENSEKKVIPNEITPKTEEKPVFWWQKQTNNEKIVPKEIIEQKPLNFPLPEVQPVINLFEDTQVSKLDFELAKIAHLKWTIRLRGFLDGKESLTLAQAVSHHHCDLGKWFYAYGKPAYGHLPDMQTLEIEHENLHKFIKTIVELKENNKLAEAEDAYYEVSGISKTIIHLLESVEAQIKD